MLRASSEVRKRTGSVSAAYPKVDSYKETARLRCGEAFFWSSCRSEGDPIDYVMKESRRASGPSYITSNHPFKESSIIKRQIFVNIAATDLAKSRAFFSSLGFSFNEQFCDDTAACLVISEEIHAMLLTHDKMKGFLPKGHEIAGPKTHEALVCLSCESREEVDRLVDKAITEGGRTFSEPQDYGFMYYRSFQDLDGHIWEMAHMDMSKIPSEEPTKAGKA